MSQNNLENINQIHEKNNEEDNDKTFKDSVRFQQLETLLKCSKCNHIFMDPVTLFCQHTFCQSCIIMNNKEDDIKCMMCQKDNIMPVNGNYQLKNIIEKIYDTDFFKDRKVRFEDFLNKNIKMKKKYEIYKKSFNESLKNIKETNGQFVIHNQYHSYGLWSNM